jgi:hypothetical protein
MGRMKDFRQFIAEDICEHNKVIDLDKAFVMADELWHDATVGKSKKAQNKIGTYVRRYRKERGD